MARHRFAVAQEMPVPAARVYAILADYVDGHPRILPRPAFIAMQIEQGGVGAGTVIHFQMRLLGRVQHFHAAISEPEPGRVLVETDLNTGAVTTFTVEPRAGGAHTYLTIATETNVRGGFLGRVQGWLTTRLLQPIYVQEMAQIAAYAAEQTG